MRDFDHIQSAAYDAAHLRLADGALREAMRTNAPTAWHAEAAIAAAHVNHGAIGGTSLRCTMRCLY